jgi:TonB family protein
MWKPNASASGNSNPGQEEPAVSELPNCDECLNASTLFELPIPATREDLKAAYRDLVKIWHPDRLGSDVRLRQRAEAAMKKINHANTHLTEHYFALRKEPQTSGTSDEFNERRNVQSVPASVPDTARSGQSIDDDLQLFRYCKIVLRTIWRVFTVLLLVLLSLIVAAIFLFGIITALSKYWGREAERERYELPMHSQTDHILDLLNALTWIPQTVLSGLITLISIVILGMVIAGSQGVLWFQEHKTAWLILVAISLLSLLIWLFYRERKAEFYPESSEHEATTGAWVMGLILLIGAPFLWFWAMPYVSMPKNLADSATSPTQKTIVSLPQTSGPAIQPQKGVLLWDFRKPYVALKLSDATVSVLRNAIEPMTGHGNDLIFSGPHTGRFFADQLQSTQRVYTASLPWAVIENRSHADGDRNFAVIVAGGEVQVIELFGGGTIVKALRLSEQLPDVLVTDTSWSGNGENYRSLKLFSVAEHRTVQLADAGVVYASDCAGFNPKGEVADRLFYNLDNGGTLTISKKEHWFRECDSKNAYQLISTNMKSAEDVMLELPAKANANLPQLEPNTDLSSADNLSTADGRPRRVGGSISTPQLIYQVEAEFSEQARKAKVPGKVVVNLWVETNGNPSHVRVLRGVGMGLDEKAIEAVKQYKFRPAMENGKPVLVEVNVEVNFQVF